MALMAIIPHKKRNGKVSGVAMGIMPTMKIAAQHSSDQTGYVGRCETTDTSAHHKDGPSNKAEKQGPGEDGMVIQQKMHDSGHGQ